LCVCRFALLHYHAYRKRASLELDACEQFTTRAAIWHHLALAGVGLLSVGLAVILGPRYAGMAGFAYMLIGVVDATHGAMEGEGQRSALAGMSGSAQPPEMKDGAMSPAVSDPVSNG
jgi:hypothetical protein